MVYEECEHTDLLGDIQPPRDHDASQVLHTTARHDCHENHALKGPKPSHSKLSVEAEEMNRYDGPDDFSDLDTGWAWVVLFASFSTFFLLGNAMYSVGIIHSTLLDKYGEGVAVTSWAGALHTAMFSLGGPLSSFVIEKYSCRTALVMSGLLFILGYITTAFAPTIEVAIFTCGVIAGTGGGLSYTASMVVVNFNFKKRRNIALGIANSGVGAGLFFIAPLVQYARQYYGHFGMFFIVSGIMVHIVLFGVLCFPSKLENYSQQQCKLESRKEKSKSVISGIAESLRPYGHVISNKGIICLCISMFFFCFGLYSMYLHLPNYITTKGFSPLEAAYLMSISGLLSILGRILTGFVANSVDELIPYAGSMCIVAVATFIYPFTSSHFIGQVAFVGTLGLFFGSSYTITATVSLKFVDIQYVAAAIGLEFFFGGIGALVGPVLAGKEFMVTYTNKNNLLIHCPNWWTSVPKQLVRGMFRKFGLLVDNGGTYDQSFIVAAFCILLGSLAGAAARCFTLAPTPMEISVKPPTEKEFVELKIGKASIT